MTHRPRLEQILLLILVLAAMAVPVTILYKVQQEKIAANRPVDVLRNWVITVDTTKEYHIGDTVTINSSFEKLLDVSGTAHRYVQCYKTGTKTWDGYVLANTVPATQPKIIAGKTSYSVGIPLAAGNAPNTCRVYVTVTYNVNKYHPAFQEYAYSNPFTLVPRSNIVTDSLGQTMIYTDTNSPQGLNSIGPVPDSQPIIIYQSPLPLPDQEAAPPTSSPSKSLLDRVDGIIKKIF